jgi:hypothetical protein
MIIVWSREKGYSGSFKVVANAIPIEATLMDLIYTSA